MAIEVVQYTKKWSVPKTEFTGNSTLQFRGDCGVKVVPVAPTKLATILFDITAMSYIVGGPGTFGEIEGQAVLGEAYNEVDGSPPAGHNTDLLLYMNDDRLLPLAKRQSSPEAGATVGLVNSATLRLHYATNGTDGVLDDLLGDPAPQLTVGSADWNDYNDITTLGAETWFKSPTPLVVGGNAAAMAPYNTFDNANEAIVTFGDSVVHTDGVVLYKPLALDITTLFKNMLGQIETAEALLVVEEESNPELPARTPEINFVINARNWTVPALNIRNALFLHTSESGYPQQPLKPVLEVVIAEQITPMT